MVIHISIIIIIMLITIVTITICLIIIIIYDMMMYTCLRLPRASDRPLTTCNMLNINNGYV